MVRVLRPDYKLMKKGDGFCLCSLKYKNVFITLPQFAAFILSLYDGKRSDQEVDDIVYYILGNKIYSFANWFSAIKVQFNRFLFPVDRAKDMFLGYHTDHVYEPKDYLVDHKSTINHNERDTSPSCLGIYLTNYCNRHCAYCYAYAQKAEFPKECSISLEEFKKIIYDAFELAVETIILTGGEALIHPNAYELISYMTSLRIRSMILTKMRLDIEKLKEADLDYIDLCFSIDSHKKDVANNITGSETFFDDMMYNIEEVTKICIPYSISVVISQINKDDIKEMVDFYIKKGVKCIHLNHYVSEKFETQDKALLLDHEEKRVVENKIYELIKLKQYKDILVLKFEQQNLTVDEVMYLKCGTGNNRLNVKFDGKYYFCDKLINDPAFNLGDVHEASLLQIWNSDALAKMMYPKQELYAGTKCGSCKEFDECNGKNSCYWLSYGAYGVYYRATKEVEHVCFQK